MAVQVAFWPRGIKRVKSAGPLGVTWTGTGNTARVGNPVFASEIGELVSVNHSTRVEDGFGGDDLSKIRLKPNGGFVGGLFRPGDHVRISKGGGRIADVELSEVTPQGDGTVEFGCKGYAHNLFDYDSIYVKDGDLSSYPTTQLMQTDADSSGDLYGWEWAQSIGMPINQIVGDTGRMKLSALRPSPVPGFEFGYLASHAADTPVKIGTILTEAYRPDNVRWYVWGRTLVLAEDTTTVKWAIEAPAGLIGTADTDYASRVGVCYVPDSMIPPTYSAATVYSAGDRVVYEELWYRKRFDTAAGVDPTETVVVDGFEMLAWDEVSSREVRPSDWQIEWAVQDVDGINLYDEKTAIVDMRGRGAMSTLEAAALAQSLLDQAKGRFVLNGSFSVGRDSGFKSAAGGYAGDSLAFVKAGDGLNLNNLRSTQGNVLPAFQIIGKTEWSWDAGAGGDGTEQLTITPMGAVARNISTILAGIPLANK